MVDELLPADTGEASILRRAARLGAYPREAYAHTKQALVTEALARVAAETPAETEAGAAVWTTAESRSARARQGDALRTRA